jgi:hypothetical protein
MAGRRNKKFAELVGDACAVEYPATRTSGVDYPNGAYNVLQNPQQRPLRNAPSFFAADIFAL